MCKQKAGYWGNFIPQIPHQMMRRYTKQGDWVLDTFAGSGTTLIEGQRLGRNTIGIELQPRMVEYARRLVASECNRHNIVIDVINDDSTNVDLRNSKFFEVIVCVAPWPGRWAADRSS